jgi:ABC-2 type transport system permease protein
MKRFIGFVKKEFYHIFRDYRTMIILFGMPVAQILIFGFVITNEINDAKIGILDKAKDNMSRQLIEKMLSSGYFLLEKELQHEGQIEESFKAGDIKQVFVFESEFGKNLTRYGRADLQIISDASDPNIANILNNYAQAIVQDFIREQNALHALPMSMLPEVRMLFNPNLDGVYMFVPGTIALILMLVSAMMTSISIAREKEFGTMETLLVSPLRPVQIILGKVTPYVVLSFINAVTIIILGFFVFGVPVQGSVVLLLAESLLFIVLALSLGILISTLSNSQQVAMFISMFAILLPTILLSGFIFPIENMPWPLQYLSTIMPPRWFIVIIKNIMIKGTGLLYVWKETLILIAMTAAFIGLSIRKFKIRLE